MIHSRNNFMFGYEDRSGQSTINNRANILKNGHKRPALKVTCYSHNNKIVFYVKEFIHDFSLYLNTHI